MATKITSKAIEPNDIMQMLRWWTTTGVRESISLEGRKKIALKITICPKNKQFALELTFYINPDGAWTSCKSVLYSWIRL